MHRPSFRQPGQSGTGSRGGAAYGSATGFNNNSGGILPSPPWGFRGPPPSVGSPRFGQYDCGSPNTPPREFVDCGNTSFHGGGKGRFNHHGSSPTYTPYRQNQSPRGGPHRNSPYNSHSPGQHVGYQGSPRHSTPFGSRGGRDSGQGARGSVEKFYNPSMLQDPWASLKPVPVTGSSQQQAANTGRPGRYFN